MASTVQRAKLPVLQNRVYGTQQEAIASPVAPFALCTCRDCGFSFNGAFDSRLVVYDEHYDNDVPSAVFGRYYEELAEKLIARFELSEGTVYEVGCGKGTFLEVLCRLAPGIRGIGVDPSCVPTRARNFTLIKDVFTPEIVRPDARLVLLRHVLEHIEEPVPFLAQIAAAAPQAPLFVEVPDLDWIFENGTFWDFCYEHCNYFTMDSLRQALTRAGYAPLEQLSLFGGQFQAAVATPGAAHRGTRLPAGAPAVNAAATYEVSETLRMRRARDLIEGCGGRAIVWGMATKGVVFAVLMADAPIAGGIDINPKKQQRFAPGSGLAIHAPEWLVTVDKEPAVFIMNANYALEIRATVASLGIEAHFFEL
jgi:SAM-dependent methyltransferase